MALNTKRHRASDRYIKQVASKDKKALLSQRWPRDRRPMYKLFTLILFALTATIPCTDFDSERI